MKKTVKLKVLLLAFSLIISSNAKAAEQILPIPKPSVDKETKLKIEQKSAIYPKKKPQEKKEKTQVNESKEISETKDSHEREDLIYPKKKPVIVKKTIDKVFKQSKILSKRDFRIARKAFDLIEKKMEICFERIKKKS